MALTALECVRRADEALSAASEAAGDPAGPGRAHALVAVAEEWRNLAVALAGNPKLSPPSPDQ